MIVFSILVNDQFGCAAFFSHDEGYHAQYPPVLPLWQTAGIDWFPTIISWIDTLFLLVSELSVMRYALFNGN